MAAREPKRTKPSSGIKRDADLFFLQTLSHLEQLLQSPTSYNQLLISRVLRQLLLDRGGLIHGFNKAHRLTFEFTVADYSNCPPLPDLGEPPEFHYQALLPDDMPPCAAARKCNLSEFLDTCLFHVQGRKISIRDYITMLANQAGGVHLSEELDEDEAIIAKVNYAARGAGIPFKYHPICEVVTATLRALEPLRQKTIEIPDEIPLIAHYETPRGSIMHFNGGQFLECDTMNLVIDEMSWYGAIVIEPNQRQSVIYAAGDAERSHLIELGINDTGYLYATLRVGEFSSSTTSFQTIEHFANRNLLVGFEIKKAEGSTALDLYVGGELQPRGNLLNLEKEVTVSRSVVGASLSGTNGFVGGVMDMILVSKACDDRERILLNRRIASNHGLLAR